MRRTSTSFASWALGLVCATSLLGCQGEPSFKIQWAIASDFESISEAVIPESPAQCTALGIDGVQVITRESGALVDERTFDCYADGAVNGPELANGSYDVQVLGLRRSLDAWVCELENGYVGDPSCTGARGCACTDDGKCDANLSCAAQFNEAGDEIIERFCEPCTARDAFTVEIDGTVPTLEAALISPPQCDDGIDNDADGLTDALDPACTTDPFADESADFTETVLDIEITFLNDNKAAECVPAAPDPDPLGVATIHLDVRNSADVIVARFEQLCRRQLPLERVDLPDGDYTLDVRGYTLGVPTGMGQKAAPVTVVKSYPFAVAGAGSFVSETVDFRGEDFLVPIAGALQSQFSFDIDADVDTSADRRGCAPTGAKQESQLVIEELALTVYDIDGAVVDPASLGFTNAVAQGDASVLPCQITTVQSASLDWDSFSIEAQGLVGGETCFASTEAQDLLPDFEALVSIPRVLVDGMPPAGCEDCSVDDDCIDSNAPRCVDGLCTPAL